jgi:uncharacterized CHY-type Zn-finger protein
MKTICKLIGHRLDVDASYYYSLDVCTRCHEEFAAQPLHVEHAKVRMVIASRWVRELTASVAGFFQKCPDCGHRWHRHDDSFDHLPF